MSRRSELAAIHCARRDLGLDEEAYRALLERVTGMRSAAGLGDAERAGVLRELGRLGWTKPPARAARRSRLPSEAHHRKVRALWLELHREGIVYDPSEPSLDKWVLRQCGLSSLRFVDADVGQRLIEMLKSWLQRALGKRAEADEPGQARYD